MILGPVPAKPQFSDAPYRRQLLGGQMESAVIYGLSAALTEQFAVKDGAVQASNFDTYTVLRMSDVPPIHTRIVTSDAAPSGMGEIGVVTVAPAIANAMFQLTGKRLRHVPMTAERVKATLKA